MAQIRRQGATGQDIGRLGQSTPAFLTKMNSDPDACFAGCYAFARDLLSICPPRVLHGIAPDRLDDVIHDLVLHCCKNDFLVLRRYEDRGRSFAGWLQLVARNRYLDLIRREKRAPTVPLDGDDDSEPMQVEDHGAAARVDGAVDRNAMLAKVREALGSLSEKCRLLVQGAAEGYKPRELVRLLGWPPDWNKKASDDLRECRRRLKKQLATLGVEPEALN